MATWHRSSWGLPQPPEHSGSGNTVHHRRILDALVERRGPEGITLVYWKPTITDGYIYFSFHHHPHVLTGVIKCLRGRANKICDLSTKNNKQTHLDKVFQANGYAKPAINSEGSPTAPTPTKSHGHDHHRSQTTLPPIHPRSKIERACHQLGVRTVFTSGNT